MKYLYIRTSYLFQIVALLAISVMVHSCSKDSDGSNFSEPGSPVFNSISIDSASNGTVVYITGTGLGDIRSIIFDKKSVPAIINPTLNTATSIVFNVPDTAKGGPQNIILTNSQGNSISVPFKVMAFANIADVSPAKDFMTGSTLTLKGVNLEDVSEVKLTGTNDKAKIITKEEKKLVIEMPVTAKPRSTLDITNSTGTTTTSQEFVSVANARVVYDDALKSGFQSWSWGVDKINLSFTGDKVCGTSSLSSGWTGAWGGLQLGGGMIDLTGMEYLTFYVKGGAANQAYTIFLDWGPQIQVNVPKGVWTYYRYKLSTLAPGKAKVENFTIQINGDPVDGNLWDNIMFIK
ncbi:MAG TPA: hypothetical protein PK191_09835 [Niabella sp.]|nr:hypothetical protein [Niabella sp.]HOZ96702.1 hypothetical protein [Niabella sp.]HQW14430.1 hypothetical protein [Niabella sp.]HQX19845.1 hypothetical protein [Niabella sp.]HQX40696.1 hypothetical protein [Niabella sp.]